MFYKRLFVWLFGLIVSLFTGCLPLILLILFLPKIMRTEKPARRKREDYSRPQKARHPDAFEKRHRREWIDSDFSKM